MQSITVNAYVLSTNQYGDSDLIVSLFSLEKGKIKAIAKGAKRSKKRFVNVLEPFSLIKAEIITPRYGNLYLFKDALLIKNSSSIAEDPLNFTYASLALELVEMWAKEEDKNPDIFWLMKWFFNRLDSIDNDLTRLSLFFQIKILILSGYYPNVARCLNCSKITDHRLPIKAIVLEDCNLCDHFKANNQAVTISIGALRTFLKICKWDLKRIFRIKMSREIMLECWLLIIEFHRVYLNSLPHSYYVLKELDSFWKEVFKLITIK